MPKLFEYHVVVSVKTLLTITLFALGVYVAFLLKEVIATLFVSILFAMAINPYVVKLERRGVSRSIGITFIYGMIIITLILVVAAVIPPFISELINLLDSISIPDSLKTSILNLEYNIQNLEVILNQLRGLPKLFEAVSTIFSVLMITVTFGVITYYILMERPILHKYLVWIFGHSPNEHTAENFVDTLEQKIGGWVRGQALLMGVIGLMTYLCLSLIGIPYALPLAILAGLLEIIPNIGPTIAAIPALIIAFTHGSTVYAGIVGAIYILIQQLENSIIVPRIMKKTANINPLVTILVIIVGLKLGGVLGGIIAVPLYLSIRVVATEIYKLKLPTT